MNKVLIGIPTAPVLDFGEFSTEHQPWPKNEWDENNRKWERVYGRFNGPATERQQAVRETWWKHQAPATCKFFMGNTATPEHQADDVVILPCGDKYLFDLQEKIQGMCKWALDHDFDVLIKVDDDTFVHPALVPYLEQTSIDFGGLLYNGFCAGGGPGEVFGRRAMEAAISASPLAFPEARHWEDRWFGEVMRAAGLTATNIEGFIDEPNISPPLRRTFHPVSPKGMHQMYKEFYPE